MIHSLSKDLPKKYGSIRFAAIDFDNTIVDSAPFPKIGELKQGVRETLHDLRDNGVKIIIWTCRTGNHKQAAIKFLRNNKVPFDWINENPHCKEAHEKVFADIYLDDRGVQFRGDWLKIRKDIERAGKRFPAHVIVKTKEIDLPVFSRRSLTPNTRKSGSTYIHHGIGYYAIHSRNQRRKYINKIKTNVARYALPTVGVAVAIVVMFFVFTTIILAKP